MVRSPQCKIWQRRRAALRKPQHAAAKTGSAPKLRRTKSRSAVKDTPKASGSTQEQPATTSADEGEAAPAAASKKRKSKAKDKETA